jgi:prevent-host-death family protein
MPDEKLPAAEFKARCLALIDRVRERGEPITITKRGRVVARLVPAGDEDERPWLLLRGQGRWTGDPFSPVVDEHDVEVLKPAARARAKARHR